MKSVVKTECIILKKIPYKEADLFVVFFSKDLGKIVVKARGGLKSNTKWGSVLETMNLIKTSLYKKENYFYVTETKIIDTFLPIKRDVNKSLVAMEILRLIDKTQTQNTDSEKVFQALTFILEEIKNSTKIRKYYYWFLLELLSLEGILFPIDQCIKCGTKIHSPFLFDKEESGFVCKNCVSASSERVADETWKLFKDLFNGKFDRMENIANNIYKETFKILYFTYKNKLGIDIIDFENKD